MAAETTRPCEALGSRARCDPHAHSPVRGRGGLDARLPLVPVVKYWRDIVVILLVGLSVALSVQGKGEDHATLRRVERDEHATSVQGAHTRKVQVQGGPPAKCLLEVMESVAPLLERVPSVERPLAEYVRLQSHRYPGVSCSDK
jgi:hypothetical protein